ncbi:hypothetical protein IPJ91_03490 [bacterium]|nr:MAG: hypothetical protein IPJ91_03490 [bacterium]
MKKYIFLTTLLFCLFVTPAWGLTSQTSAEELVSTTNSSIVSASSVTEDPLMNSSSTSINQGNFVIKDSTGNSFSLKIKPGIQDIFSLKVPIELNIESFIDTDRFELSYIISPDKSSVELSIPNNVVGKLKIGDKKSFVLYVYPKKSGSTTIYIYGQAWQNDLTLTDVTSITINFDKDLQVTPQSDEFKKNYQTWERIKFGLKFFGFIILIFLFIFLFKKFALWWRRD